VTQVCSSWLVLSWPGTSTLLEEPVSEAGRFVNRGRSSPWPAVDHQHERWVTVDLEDDDPT
jgi:hypothetical protein